jgi:hypothetical protein
MIRWVSGPWPFSPRPVARLEGFAVELHDSPVRAARLLFVSGARSGGGIRRRIALSDYQNVKATRQNANGELI